MTDRRSPTWRLLVLMLGAIALLGLVAAAACTSSDDDGDDDDSTPRTRQRRRQTWASVARKTVTLGRDIAFVMLLCTSLIVMLYFGCPKIVVG